MSERTAQRPDFSSMMRPIAMPGHRRLDRHAGVHHRHRAAADRRHRRGAVRLENVGDETDGVGELVLAGHDRRERAFGQRAVADLAPAGAAQELHFAHRERREVVVQHEALVELAAHVLDLLLVVGRAERAGDERLRLAAGEDDGAVDARQDARLRTRSGGSRRTCGRRAGRCARALRRAAPFPSARGRCASLRPCAGLRPRAATRRTPRAPGRRGRSSPACRGCASPR